jgi:hypothetical protein
MDASASARLLLTIAAIFALGALCIGCVFLRSSPVKSARGVIRGKVGMGGGTYSQQQVGAQRGFRTPNTIAIAPSYSFEVEIQGVTEHGRCSLNTVAAEKFEIGQEVEVEYLTRGVKGIWSRVFVTKMGPVVSGRTE